MDVAPASLPVFGVFGVSYLGGTAGTYAYTPNAASCGFPQEADIYFGGLGDQYIDLTQAQEPAPFGYFGQFGTSYFGSFMPFIGFSTQTNSEEYVARAYMLNAIIPVNDGGLPVVLLTGVKRVRGFAWIY